MTVTMIDATGVEAAWVKANLPNPQMLAIYDTGSAGIVWTQADKALFPHTTFVTIDQGGNGSPISASVVRDVEPGAWVAANAEKIAGWTAARKTIYCDRSELDLVVNAGWRGDVWLAWPGWNGEQLPHMDKVRIVAVQNGWHGTYDSSVVLDPSWPFGTVTPPAGHHLSVTVAGRIIDAAWDMIVGATEYIIDYVSVPGVMPLTIDIIPQPVKGGAIHAEKVPVPGAKGGAIRVSYVHDGITAVIASTTLP